MTQFRCLCLSLIGLLFAIPGLASECSTARVQLPGGSFQAGSNSSPFPDSRQTGIIQITGFQIDLTEVAAQTFVSFAEQHQLQSLGRQLLESELFRHPCFPARGVPWEQARAFCQSQGGDLPSEIQWEYAATQELLNPKQPRWPSKGGTFPRQVNETTTLDDEVAVAEQADTNLDDLEIPDAADLLDSEDLDNLLDLVEAEIPTAEDLLNTENLDELLEELPQELASSDKVDTVQNLEQKIEPGLVPVQFAYLGANGIHGMTGNVWEWTRDWYSQINGSQAESGFWKVVRGGSYLNLEPRGVDGVPVLLNPFIRNPVKPEAEKPHIGFRCAYPLATSRS